MLYTNSIDLGCLFQNVSVFAMLCRPSTLDFLNRKFRSPHVERNSMGKVHVHDDDVVDVRGGREISYHHLRTYVFICG